jgi:hypothetical protein
MSSPSPPKARKVNPYQGINANPEIFRAQQQLGINKIKKNKHLAKINEQVFKNRVDDAMGDKYFRRAARDLDINNIDKQSEMDRIYAQVDKNTYESQSRDQQKQLEEQYERMRADQLADAKTQQKLMEEMMNQPVYMPKQQQMPVVQAPRRQQEPMLPAPAPNTPMSIAAPPAPELTNTGNRMAIIRSPKSIQARSRRATRGTSSLRN